MIQTADAEPELLEASDGGFDAEAAAVRLEATGLYRVLHKYVRPEHCTVPDERTKRLGLVLDCETLGLAVADPVIEIGMAAFEYDPATGTVYRILSAQSWLEDPGCPIPEPIRRLTGITDAMVRGQSFDRAELGRWVERADIVIAHNATFDRCRLERIDPRLAAKPWACTHQGIDWAEQGVGSSKLAFLAMCYGFYFEAHRAQDDCLALLHVLANPLPLSGHGTLAMLLDGARRPVARVWAVNSAFDAKDALKARGYGWSPGEGRQRKDWYRDCRPEDAPDELAWLRDTIGCLGQAVSLDAYSRYSDRAFAR
ncbi:3'-5' exonuclease [Roseomonas genomospecies 6]|uniref:3'-5' exonuclease n=1 Tax=Roseomonas genomospecies 6 TaxID=214106 RepID=A0A9W7KN98_9PROT|nr:3'-5' exonuclease [Roseomonas genomospecies 6]KAA0675832.1 3'-5' exonuclease [Roseomonas genomospecies 6]